MLPHDMSVFAVHLNLFAACICYIVANPLLKQHREGSCLQGILFQICYAYKVRRVNNILIIGHPVTLLLDNVMLAHQTSDMSRCTISPESRLKLEMVILSSLRFLTILTFQYVNYQFMCPYFNKH